MIAVIVYVRQNIWITCRRAKSPGVVGGFALFVLSGKVAGAGTFTRSEEYVRIAKTMMRERKVHKSDDG